MQQKSNRFQLLVSLAVSSMILSLLTACTSTSTDCPPNSKGQVPQECASGRRGSSSGGSYYRSGGSSRSNGGDSSSGITRSGRSGFGSFGGGRAGG